MIKTDIIDTRTGNIIATVQDSADDLEYLFNLLTKEQQTDFLESVKYSYNNYFADDDEAEIKDCSKMDYENILLYCTGMIADDENEDYKKDETTVIYIHKEDLTENEIDDNADFYSIQVYCDGFGNDTATQAVFKTLKEAISYVKTEGYAFEDIVPQYWGEYTNKYN